MKNKTKYKSRRRRLLAATLAALFLAGSARAGDEHEYMAVFYVPGVCAESGKPFVWNTVYFGDSEADVRAAIYEACAAEYGAEPRAVIKSIKDLGPAEPPVTY